MNTLLRTTALVAFVLGAPAAYAQTVQTPGATPNASSSATVPVPGELFLIHPTAGAHLASHLIGMTVYTGEHQDAEALGNINDLVVAQDGSIEAAIVGVGGFLGVGEKNVAVDFDQLAWVVTPDVDQPAARLVLAATAAQIEQAPAFDVTVFETDPSLASSTALPVVPGAVPDVTTAQTMPAQDSSSLSGPATYTDVDVATISANEMINATVFSAENDNVGSVGDVILADDGTIDAVVLDIGGFLGLGQKPVAIAFDSLSIRRDENGNLFVFTRFGREQLEQAPDYNADRYLMERETMRLRSS